MRRTSLTAQAARVVHHLTEKLGMTQSEIAEIIGVHRSFVTRCKNAEREFGPGHINAIAEHLGLPMGAFLMAVSPADLEHPNPKVREVQRLAAELMTQLDEFRKSRKQASADVEPATAA